MFTVAVNRSFVAQHFLVGGDWGVENHWHSHAYRVELRLDGAQLDQHGYLVDIVAIEEALDTVVSGVRDQTLNELPAFSGLNPSIEHLARLLAEGLNERIHAPNVTALTVVVWENEIAWASYRLPRA